MRLGFGIKAFQIGSISNDYKYFNYNTSSNESFSVDGTFLNAGFAYKFKSEDKKADYHLLFEIRKHLEDDIEDYEFNEVMLQLGARF